MGAKQPRGLMGAGWPPIMIFGAKRWDVWARSRAGGEGGEAMWGLGARSPAPPFPSHEQSEPQRLLAGSLPRRRHKPAAIPLAAPSRPTTVTGSVPGGHGSSARQHQRVGKGGEEFPGGAGLCSLLEPPGALHQRGEEEKRAH